MIAALLLAVSVQTTTAPTPPAQAPAPGAIPAPNPAEPPHDWSTLAAITLPPAGPDMVRFVRDEVRAGRCSRAKATDAQMVLAVPLAIGCPTVEQFTAGAAQRMVRHLAHRTTIPGGRWYRTVITYTWPG